jgi:hypothetical protein
MIEVRDHQLDDLRVVQGLVHLAVRVCNKQTIQSDVVRLDCLDQSERWIKLFEVNCSDYLDCL